MIATKPRQIQLPEILLAVCSEFGISQKDLCGKKRTKNRVTARHCAMYLARKLTDLSLSEIGESFHNRHHTSVLHGADKIADEINSDCQLKHRLDRIVCQLYLGPVPTGNTF